MKNLDRELKIKQALDSEIYKKIDNLDNLEDDTFSSTGKLANILDGYMTKVDDMKVIEEDAAVLEIIDEQDVEIEINDQDLLKDYNEKIHEFGLDTLSELLSKDEPNFDDETTQIEIKTADEEENEIDQIISTIDDYTSKIEKNINLDEDNLEEEINLKKINTLDDITIDLNEDNDENTNEFTQTIISPITINEENEDFFEDEEEKKISIEKKKFDIFDIAIVVAIVILFLIIIYLIVGY